MPANIMISNNKAFVIDFGLASITSSAEDFALDLLLMQRSISYDMNNLFLKSYSASYKDSQKVLIKLKEIELRGRYQQRTLASMH
mgnify:CR=1 FL=1